MASSVFIKKLYIHDVQYKVSSVFHRGFSITVKKLWLTLVMKFVVEDAAEAYPFSGNGALTASSASCSGVAVALVQFEC